MGLLFYQFWKIIEIFYSPIGDRPIRASAQKNVTEEGDDRRWKAYSVLEYVFSQDDYGKNLICRVNHPAYANEYEEASVKLDLLCKY